MYTEADYRRTRRGLWLRIAVNVVIALATIGVAAVGITLRIKWLAIVPAVLGGALFYAFLTLKTAPWYRYDRFLCDVKNGLNRETEGWFVSCAREARLSDGVQVHDFIIRVGEREEDERLFYWDDDKPAPALEPGQRVRIRSFGNYILELE